MCRVVPSYVAASDRRRRSRQAAMTRSTARGSSFGPVGEHDDRGFDVVDERASPQRSARPGRAPSQGSGRRGPARSRARGRRRRRRRRRPRLARERGEDARAGTGAASASRSASPRPRRAPRRRSRPCTMSTSTFSMRPVARRLLGRRVAELADCRRRRGPRRPCRRSRSRAAGRRRRPSRRRTGFRPCPAARPPASPSRRRRACTARPTAACRPSIARPAGASAVGSPPWITKPGTIRWKTVRSKNPCRASATRDARCPATA